MDYPGHDNNGKYFQVEIETTDGIFIDQLLIDDEVIIDKFCISDAMKNVMISADQYAQVTLQLCESTGFESREEWEYILLDHDGSPFNSYGIMPLPDDVANWAIKEGAIILDTC